MENMQLYGVLAVPLITGFVQMATSSGFSKKYAPLLSLVAGLAIGIAGFSNGNIMQGIIIGSALGLAASGFYSNIKVTNK